MSARPSSGEQINRRNFLSRSSQAIASGMVLAQAPLAARGHPTAMSKIKIGVIGCGGRGSGAVLDALGAATHVIYPQAGYHTVRLRWIHRWPAQIRRKQSARRQRDIAHYLSIEPQSVLPRQHPIVRINVHQLWPDSRRLPIRRARRDQPVHMFKARDSLIRR